MEFCPPRLGSDRRIFELLSRLGDTNNIHFVVFPPGRAFLGLIPFPTEHKEENDNRLGRNLTAHYLAVPAFLQRKWTNLFFGYLLTLLFLFPETLRKIKDIDPDIVVINYPSAYTGLCGFLIGRILGRKVVTEFNDIIAYYTVGLFGGQGSSTVDREKIPTKILRGALVLVQNTIVKNANMVTALTTYTIRYAELCGIKKTIHLIPDGVDTALFNPRRASRSEVERIRSKHGLKRDDRMILYIGRLEKWAGVDLILKCAKRLRQSKAKFLLVGEGNIELQDSTPNVVCCGKVPHETVVNYLALADVVLVPMSQDPLGQSASPLKLFEAMAMGKPVIASNTQGIRDVISPQVNGVPLPFEETCWAETIADIIKNPALAARLGRNARKTIESSYDWDILTKKFERLLYQLVNS